MAKTLTIKIGNLEFECRYAGNQKDELVIFLHGFTETSHMWKRLISEIASHGFYCLAPNLRGYSRGARPRGRKNYRLPHLAADVMAIAKFTGNNKFHLIGHDWGAAIGWKVAHDHPDTILSWTSLSLPHLQAFGEALFNDPKQHRMSQYIRAFQLPLLPELRIRKNNFEVFKRLWKHSTEEEKTDYLAVFSERRALTSALNYYRGNYPLFRTSIDSQILGDIEVPSLFIWGKTDRAIGAMAVENSHQFMKGDYRYLELDAGHWLIQTKFPEIKKVVLDHISKYRDI